MPWEHLFPPNTSPSQSWACPTPSTKVLGLGLNKVLLTTKLDVGLRAGTKISHRGIIFGRRPRTSVQGPPVFVRHVVATRSTTTRLKIRKFSGWMLNFTYLSVVTSRVQLKHAESRGPSAVRHPRLAVPMMSTRCVQPYSKAGKCFRFFRLVREPLGFQHLPIPVKRFTCAAH